MSKNTRWLLVVADWMIPLCGIALLSGVDSQYVICALLTAIYIRLSRGLA